jgi:hypothetical protein
MERDKREKFKSEDERGDRDDEDRESRCPVSELRRSIMCWNFPTSKKRTEPRDDNKLGSTTWNLE